MPCHAVPLRAAPPTLGGETCLGPSLGGGLHGRHRLDAQARAALGAALRVSRGERCVPGMAAKGTCPWAPGALAQGAHGRTFGRDQRRGLGLAQQGALHGCGNYDEFGNVRYASVEQAASTAIIQD